VLAVVLDQHSTTGAAIGTDRGSGKAGFGTHAYPSASAMPDISRCEIKALGGTGHADMHAYEASDPVVVHKLCMSRYLKLKS
jgi:hypothetical protein